MTVYLDSLFLVNFFMDSVIVFTVTLLSRSHRSVLRLFLGSLIYAVYGTALIIPQLHIFYTVFFKLIFSVLPLLVVFGYNGIRHLLKVTASFWIVSVMLGGILYALTVFTDFGAVMNASITGGGFYMELNPFIAAAGCVLLYAFVKLYAIMCIRNFSRERLLLDLRVFHCGKEYKLTALVDTGCDACEPLRGSPAVIADRSVFKDAILSDIKIYVDTLAGTGSLDCIIPEKIICQNSNITITDGTIVALSPRKLSSSALYNAIVNPDAIIDLKSICEKSAELCQKMR